jgi:hypothetical protein
MILPQTQVTRATQGSGYPGLILILASHRPLDPEVGVSSSYVIIQLPMGSIFTQI